MSPEEQTGFEQWLTYTFDRPVSDDRMWIWNDAHYLSYRRPDDRSLVAYWTKTFEEADTVLRPFSDAQVAQGLDAMINPELSNDPHMLSENAAALEDRLRCITSMGTLFEKCFAKRCSPHLSHLIRDVRPEGLSPLNGICYMWWDILPIHGFIEHRPNNPDSAQIDSTVLAVIKHILTIDSIPCQESALLGVDNWSIYYPQLDDFVEEYAENHPGFWDRLNPEIQESESGS